MAYLSQQHLDGMVDHALRRKEIFDRQVRDSAPKEVVFHAGNLVQVYRNDLDYTFKTGEGTLTKILGTTTPRLQKTQLL
jgi:hypothetical protein